MQDFDSPFLDGAVVLAAIRRQALMVGVLTLLGVAGAIGLSFMVEPRYAASAVLLPVNSDLGGDPVQGLRGGLGGLAALAGVSLNGQASMTQANLAELSSDTFARDFIASHNLMPVLFREKWNASSGKWREGAPGKAPTVWDGIKRFKEDILGVNEDKLTGLVKLRIEWRNPAQAAEWANQMILDMNNRVRKRVNVESARSIKFLEQELRKTSVLDMQQIIYRMIQEQTHRAMLANVREEYAFKVVEQAFTPDPKHRTFPKRSIFGGMGLLLGLLAGTILALWRDRRR